MANDFLAQRFVEFHTAQAKRAEQKAIIAKAMHDFQEKVSLAKTAEEFNQLVTEAKALQVDGATRLMLARDLDNKAEKNGLKYNKEAKCYE